MFTVGFVHKVRTTLWNTINSSAGKNYSIASFDRYNLTMPFTYSEARTMWYS